MSKRVCPIWIGYLLLNPIIKLYQNPEKILSPYVSEGMTVLDMGCAMGYFSLPLARMVGTGGKVMSGFKILASPCVNQTHAVLMEKLTKGSL
ncbi:SAM-dependent methyltransferase domain-containing protein [Desulfonema limicola]|uniref:SAM-dependent methyltransferase domain-containing protein n=1 Tax=Desulfonema limicola TaxID=45656 RepID=A0A975GJS1_9BACT|nr:hypothetical protein [Desulfonema limicola]QTA83790.1 SAM-dependent methyltransferase domain-containing protein [Desulfonema limicola]